MDRFQRLTENLVRDLERQAESLPDSCLPVTLLERYLAGDVDESTRTDIDAHLDQCLVCLNREIELRDLLHAARRPAPPSPRLAATLESLTTSRSLGRRLGGRVKTLLEVRLAAGWVLAPIAAAVLVTWIIASRGPSLPGGSRLMSPSPMAELAGQTKLEQSGASKEPRFGRSTQSTSPFVTVSGPKPPLDVPALVSATQDSVVLVTGLDKIAPDREGRPRRYGSGFIIHPSGFVLTSYHVIKGSAAISVQLNNGASFTSEKVVVANPERDFAVLKVPGRSLPALGLGDSASVRAGEQVVALGSPLGLENSVSTGVISGIRQLKAGSFIQTTAPISEGSSGGPLLDMKGAVIGMTASSAVEGQAVNFAIPINEIRATVTEPAAAADGDRSLQAYFDGVLYSNRQEYAKAEQAFLKATELNPDNFDAWLDLGAVYYLTGKTDKEIAAYQKAVSLRPNHDDAHYNLGSALEEKGRFDAAEAEYRRALSLNPKHIDALFNLALLQVIAGRRVEATASYERLRAMNYGMALKLRRLLDLTPPK